MRIITTTLIALGLLLTAAVLPSQAHTNAKVIHMTACMVSSNGAGGWSPKRIVVKKGEKVTLEITSLDLTHSFVLPAFHVNSGAINGGSDVKVTFVANKDGSFPFHCGTICGPFHSKMVGTLVVEPATASASSAGPTASR